MKRARVVVADDTDEIRALLRAALERDGRFDVVAEAGDGASAIEQVWHSEPDAIVLDLAMPVMDGLQAIPELRRIRPGLRILVLSGFSSAQASAEALNLGADAYLRKGVAFKQLANVLADLCELGERAQGAGVHAAGHVPSLDAAPRPAGAAPPNGVLPFAGVRAAPDDPLERILSHLAHELLTPLTVIQGFAATLHASAGDLDRSQIQMCAEAIERRAQELSGQIRTLADARAIGRDGLDVAGRQTAIHATVRSVAAMLEHVTAGRTVLLDLEEIVTVVDPQRLEQLVAALIENAGRHTPRGSIITIDLHVDGDSMHLEVADDGPGIAADRIELAFSMFGRLDDATPGAGLGLFVARGIARAHGGELTYEPVSGGGSRFTFSLPVHTDRLRSVPKTSNASN